MTAMLSIGTVVMAETEGNLFYVIDTAHA